MNGSNLAPVLIFCYKRLDTLKQTVVALQKNKLAASTELFIFSDGPKTEADKIIIDELRNYIKSITFFKKVVVKESATNKGLATSIIDGVTEVLNEYNSVIVLEDDLLTSSNFLEYMNEALHYYGSSSKVFSISGYSFPVSNKQGYLYDNYFTKRGSSWGWATWKNRWSEIDWNVNDYQNFLQEKRQQQLFNTMGSDLTNMLNKQMNGKISSWAIRWVYHQFKHDLYTVYPTVSKIENIGFGEGATHTKERFSRYKTSLDQSNKTAFSLNPEISLDPYFVKQFTYRYSLFQRILYKALNVLANG